MKAIFKDNIKSYLLIFLIGIIAGLSVVLFLELPNNDLWTFSYWSSKTFGFWIFSTSLIVLLSEKRKVAIINTAMYIFIMFLMSAIYMTFCLYWKGYSPFNSLMEVSLNNIYGWLIYSLPSAIICGVLGAILWDGRKNNIHGRILCILPAIFILIEVSFLFYNVIIEHTKLFSAITDLICFILYIKFLRKNIKNLTIF